MRVLVCFRPEPNLDSLLVSAWREDKLPEELLYQKPGWNCFEESALALSLAAQKQSGGDLQLRALTVGVGPWAMFSQPLYALGFSEVIAVNEETKPFHSMITAQTISAAVRKFDCNIVITGHQSGLGGSGAVPLLTAEYLHWPCISNVTDISWDADGLLITSNMAHGVVVQRTAGPCVLSVGNAVLTTLPVPTLRDKLTLGRKPITVLDYAALGLTDLSEDPFVLKKLHPVRQERSSQILDGQISELAKRLMAFCGADGEVRQ